MLFVVEYSRQVTTTERGDYMAGAVDLNVKIQIWKVKLAELEAQAKRFRDKIVFAEEILREEDMETSTEQTSFHAEHSIPIPTGANLSEMIRQLFLSHPTMAITNDFIFSYLDEKGIQYKKPSVYSILSKFRSKGLIEVAEGEGSNKLKKEEAEKIPFSYVQN